MREWFLRACVRVCVGGLLRRLWASLIKECVGDKLVFLRSNFKVKVVEGSFLGPENVLVSPQTLTRLMIDKTAWRVAAGVGFFLCVRSNGGNRTKSALSCVVVRLWKRRGVTDL